MLQLFSSTVCKAECDIHSIPMTTTPCDLEFWYASSGGHVRDGCITIQRGGKVDIWNEGKVYASCNSDLTRLQWKIVSGTFEIVQDHNEYNWCWIKNIGSDPVILEQV